MTCFLAFLLSFSVFLYFLYVCVRSTEYVFRFFQRPLRSTAATPGHVTCPFVICPLIIIIIIIIVDVAVAVGHSRRIGMTIDRLAIFPVSVLYIAFLIDNNGHTRLKRPDHHQKEVNSSKENRAAQST